MFHRRITCQVEDRIKPRALSLVVNRMVQAVYRFELKCNNDTNIPRYKYKII